MKVPRKPCKPSGKNILTNPPKRGSGYRFSMSVDDGMCPKWHPISYIVHFVEIKGAFGMQPWCCFTILNSTVFCFHAWIVMEPFVP
jgi:hypothetical protein